MQVAITYHFFCWMLKSFPVLIISHLPWLYPIKDRFMASQSIMVKCIIPVLKNTVAYVRPSLCRSGARWIICCLASRCKRSSVVPQVCPPGYLFLAWRKRWKSRCGETGTIDSAVVNFIFKDKNPNYFTPPPESQYCWSNTPRVGSLWQSFPCVLSWVWDLFLLARLGMLTLIWQHWCMRRTWLSYLRF